MAFDSKHQEDEELRQAAQAVFGQHTLTQTLNNKCLYTTDTQPCFGEVPIMYTEFIGGDKKRLRDRIVYVSVN